MKQTEVNKIVEALTAEGKTKDEIRKALFNTKGVKMAQMRKVGVL